MTSNMESRQSYGAVADRLAELASSAEADSVASLADELLTVADLLRGEPRLRRALSDPGRSGEDRAGLARSIFGSKVRDETLDLLAALTAGHWTRPSDLLDAVERLGVEAVLASSERAGDLADVEDELFRFGQVVDGDYRLAAALGDATADVARRAALVDDLLDGKSRPATVRLAKLALAGFGGRGFASSLSRLVELAAERGDKAVAYVTTAVPLTDADEDRLAARLSEMYGRGIALKINLDPEIVGGLRVKIGSDLYDGTVARRLAEARTALTR
jgi:F-type H+-transporting ATPase subunit delta